MIPHLFKFLKGKANWSGVKMSSDNEKSLSLQFSIFFKNKVSHLQYNTQKVSKCVLSFFFFFFHCQLFNWKNIVQPNLLILVAFVIDFLFSRSRSYVLCRDLLSKEKLLFG